MTASRLILHCELGIASCGLGMDEEMTHHKEKTEEPAPQWIDKTMMVMPLLVSAEEYTWLSEQ